MTQKLVKENMSTHLITIGWGQSMSAAYRRMQAQRIRHLPVIDDQGHVAGMLSDRDVQRAMISEIDRSSGISDERVEFDPDSQVRDYMSWPAIAIDQRSDLRAVAIKMISEKISSLLVCQGERITGIVTADDLLKVLVELLSDPETSSRWTLGHIVDGAFTKLESTLV